MVRVGGGSATAAAAPAEEELRVRVSKNGIAYFIIKTENLKNAPCHKGCTKNWETFRQHIFNIPFYNKFRSQFLVTRTHCAAHISVNKLGKLSHFKDNHVM